MFIRCCIVHDIRINKDIYICLFIYLFNGRDAYQIQYSDTSTTDST